MKWQRLSATPRVIAGILAALMLFVGLNMIVALLERGGSRAFVDVVAILMTCGISGVIFGLAAIAGRSPDVLALYADIVSRGRR